jgi:hypothetical protein
LGSDFKITKVSVRIEPLLIITATCMKKVAGLMVQ